MYPRCASSGVGPRVLRVRSGKARAVTNLRTVPRSIDNSRARGQASSGSSTEGVTQRLQRSLLYVRLGRSNIKQTSGVTQSAEDPLLLLATNAN